MGITCNKNSVPFDDKSPFVTSGIRLGSPALTTRGMRESEMKIIGELISDVIENIGSEDVKSKVSNEIKELTAGFDFYNKR